jgi:hypothetical protein
VGKVPKSYEENIRDQKSTWVKGYGSMTVQAEKALHQRLMRDCERIKKEFSIPKGPIWVIEDLLTQLKNKGVSKFPHISYPKGRICLSWERDKVLQVFISIDAIEISFQACSKWDVTPIEKHTFKIASNWKSVEKVTTLLIEHGIGG